MHTWFHAQLKQKICDGIYYSGLYNIFSDLSRSWGDDLTLMLVLRHPNSQGLQGQFSKCQYHILAKAFKLVSRAGLEYPANKNCALTVSCLWNEAMKQRYLLKSSFLQSRNPWNR